MKMTTRDASLRSQYKHELNTIFRDIERWVSEAKVSANFSSGGMGWDSDDQEGKEKWALEQLCEALLEKGALVPLSKKYSTSRTCIHLADAC